MGNSKAIEETFLVAKWPFALKRIDKIEGELNGFKEIEGIDDCMKIAVITPSNLEWYIEGGKIYFKGNRLDSMFYFAGNILQRLMNNDNTIVRQVPESFRLLASLSLVAQISFAMYSDSLFAEGLRKQYLIKLDEVRKIYHIDYNLINSGTI